MLDIIWLALIAGLLCGFLLHWVPFLLMAEAAVIGLVVALLWKGDGLLASIGWALLANVALQLAYLTGVFASYALVRKAPEANGTQDKLVRPATIPTNCR